MKFARVLPILDREREHVSASLQKVGAVEFGDTTRVTEPLQGRNFAGDPFVTDGKACLLVLREP